MKIYLILVLVFLFCLNLFSTQTFWSEGFESYANHTGVYNDGGTVTNSGDYPIASGKWSLDVSGAPNFDHVYTYPRTTQVLQIKQTGVGGQVVFETETIDISQYYNVNINVQYEVSQYVSTVSSNDSIMAFYKLDGGSEQMFTDGNGKIVGEVTHYNQNAQENNLCGAYIQIIIKATADDVGDIYEINKITVSGLPVRPSNHVTDVTGVENNISDQIEIRCVDDQTAETYAEGYLVEASTGTITDPIDGVVPGIDDDLSDGEGRVFMIGDGEADHYVAYFQNYHGTTTYHFKIFPFTNSSCHGYAFKKDGVVPGCDVTTNPDPVNPGVIDLIINEISGDDVMPNPMDGYIEIYNRRSWEIDLSNVEVRYYDNGSPVPTAILALSGKVMPHDFVVVCQDVSMFTMSYPDVMPGFEAPKDGDGNTLFPLDGGLDVIELYINTKAGTIDTFNDPSTPWNWDSSKNYERNSTNDGDQQTSWDDNGDGQPGEDDDPLAITLSSFTASFTNGSTLLQWITLSEENNMGWNIYRNLDDNIEDAKKINPSIIPGYGTTTEPHNYSYNDNQINFEEDTYIYYWIESIDYSGSSELYGPSKVYINTQDNPQAPDINKNCTLHQNYPNPFNPETKISFYSGNSSFASLKIYNIKGQIVNVLYNGNIESQKEYNFSWNGKNSNGQNVSSGVYFYVLQTDTNLFKKKMILLK